jgi:hypothetical protein
LYQIYTNMKYRINQSSVDESFDLITEDGGVAVFYHNTENYVTNYYAKRLSECNPANNVWGELSEGKSLLVYTHRQEDPTVSEVIKDMLDWLVCPPPAEGWQQDDTIWAEFFDKEGVVA